MRSKSTIERPCLSAAIIALLVVFGHKSPILGADDAEEGDVDSKVICVQQAQGQPSSHADAEKKDLSAWDRTPSEDNRVLHSISIYGAEQMAEGAESFNICINEQHEHSGQLAATRPAKSNEQEQHAEDRQMGGLGVHKLKALRPRIKTAPPSRIDRLESPGGLAEIRLNAEAQRPSGNVSVALSGDPSSGEEDLVRALEIAIPKALMPCYLRRLDANPNLKGAVVVLAGLEPSGMLKSPSIKIDLVGDLSLAGCVLAKLEELSLGSKLGDLSPLRIQFPIYFTIE